MTPSVYWLLISPLNFSFITSFKLEREYLCRFIVIQYVCINMIILNDTSVVVKALFHLCVCLSSCVVFISFFHSFYNTFNSTFIDSFTWHCSNTEILCVCAPLIPLVFRHLLSLCSFSICLILSLRFIRSQQSIVSAIALYLRS